MKIQRTIGRVLAALTALALMTFPNICNSQDQNKGQDSPVNQELDTTETFDFSKSAHSLPDLPKGITSFGGAKCANYLYAFGGNAGSAHEYCRDGQNAILYRLDLENPEQWDEVNTSRGLQGLAMVSHDEKLYRMGGFEARNEEGDDQDLHSVDIFEVLDTEKGEWSPLVAMPEPRSSFDAAVVGDTLFVVGGWALAGDGDTKWSETAWSIDLSNLDEGWKELPKPPFTRRAMSVSFQDNMLAVIGGMQEKGGPTRRVAVYNIETREWSEGPELPKVDDDDADKMEGFGNSSFNVGGRLCVSTYGGNVYRLDKTGKQWVTLGTVDDRFFHRLLPLSDDRFALIGGASMKTGKRLKVDVVEIEK